jgi:hypothetical protein
MTKLLWLAMLALAGSSLAAEPAAKPAAAPTASTDDDADPADGVSPAKARAPEAPRYGIDHFLVEAGGFPNSEQADYSLTLRASAFVSWRPDAAWELRLGGQVNGVTQGGGVSDFTQWQALFTDTFVRWRSADTRLTLGEQTIIWGRVDAIPLIDRVSRIDLTRFALDDLRERRLADLALRWEQDWGDLKLDAVALPLCRCALMPDVRSVWSPVNQVSGEVIGIAPSPQLANLVRNATINDDTGGFGGGGLRLTQTGGGFDFGLTLARTRQSAPYYLVDINAAALNGIHPFNNFAGLDAEWATGDFTWRTELGYTADVPVTLPTAAMVRTDAVEWVGAVEFFPGGKDTRVNLQLLSRSLRTSETILELKNYLGLNGAVESTFAQGRWKAALQFAVGLSVSDWYLAPSVSYVGWEPYEVYLAGYYFAGEDQTYGGFFRKQNMVALGIRKRF